jgi:hypothetical protein
MHAERQHVVYICSPLAQNTIMTTHFTVLSFLSSSRRTAQIIGDCPWSFPIGTWALWLQTTLEMHLAEPPSLAKTATDGTFLLRASRCR